MPNESRPYIDYIPHHFNSKQQEALNRMKEKVVAEQESQPESDLLLLVDSLSFGSQHPSESIKKPIPEFTPNKDVLMLFSNLDAKITQDFKEKGIDLPPKMVYPTVFPMHFGPIIYIVGRTAEDDMTSIYVQRVTTGFHQGTMIGNPLDMFVFKNNGEFAAFAFRQKENSTEFEITLEAEHSLSQPNFTPKVRDEVRRAKDAIAPFIISPRG